MTRLLLWHLSTTRLTAPLGKLWHGSTIWRLRQRANKAVPPKWTLVTSWLVLLALIAAVVFVQPDLGDNNATNRGISLAGLALAIGLLWLTSRHRSQVCWHSVLVGLYLQFLVGLFVLRTQVGYNIFDFVSDRATDLLGFSDDGLAFLTDDAVPGLSWFVISVVPPIIFFAGIAQILSYM